MFLFVCLFNVSCHRDQPKIQDENEEPIQLFSYSVQPKIQDENEEPIQLFSYSVQPNGEIAITGLTAAGKACTEISIPEIIEDKPVTIIDSVAFSGGNNLDSIKIPQSIKKIGHQAFSCCPNLTGITVSDLNEQYSTLDGLLYNKNQTKLFCCPEGRKGEIVIPDSVISIEESAFVGCTSITSIIVSNFTYVINDLGAFITGLTNKGSRQSSLVIPERLGEYPVMAIDQNVCGEQLISITIPDSVSTVTKFDGKYDLFSNKTDWRELHEISTTDKHKKNIFRYLFENCSNLTEIKVYPDSAKYSSVEGVLYNKEQTKLIYCPRGKKGELTIPDTVMEIEEFAFYNCGLNILRLPKATPLAASLAGMNNDIYLGADVSYISSECFSFDSSEVSLAEELYSYEQDLKTGGYASKQIISSFPNIHISDDNPYYCANDGVIFSKDKSKLVLCCGKKAGEYIIPEMVTEISDYAFAGCKNLTKIIIPENVVDIGSCVFYNCTGLTSIIIPSKTKYIGKYMFDGCLNLTDITILGGEIDDFAFSSLDVSGGDKSWFDARYTVTCKRLNIGENVSRLSPLCFYEGYRRVGGGEGRFFSFPQIIIDDKNPYYCCFDEVVFNRNKTEIIFCSQKKTGEYIVPDTVTTIKEFSFAGSNLNSVILSRDLVNIEKCAFYGFQNYPLQIKIKTIKFFKKYKNKGGDRCCIDELFVDYSGWDYDYIYNVNLLFLDDEIEERELFSWQIDHRNSTIIISDAMTVIPSDLFSDCSFLQFVIIPNSITYIDSGAFSGCETLETIRIERNEPPISSPDIFEHCSLLTSIEVPSSAVETYKTAEGWSGYAGIIVGY